MIHNVYHSQEYLPDEQAHQVRLLQTRPTIKHVPRLKTHRSSSTPMQAGENELLVRVKAVGINRAECLHRAGKYKIGKPSEAFIGL
jgi:NADPH:quinone reductase-like Zn-dependent oxidoreductase